MKTVDRSLLPDSRQLGLTLVELMIGIALSLLVILAVISVFSGSRASYRHQESFSAVQESGRIALEVLGRDLRMAGYPGCGNLGFLNHRSANAPDPLDRFSNEVALAGDSNAITLVRGSAESTLLTASPAGNQIEVGDLSVLGAVAAGDRLLLTDCAFTEVLRVAAVAGNQVTAVANLSRQFRPGTQVMRLERVVFARSAANELTRNNQPIVAGVTALNFQYGIAAPGSRSSLNYNNAPTADELNSTVVVRIGMTMRENDIAMPFNSTVTLRNRAP